MIKEREQQINNIFGVFDVFLSLLTFAAAYFIRALFIERPLHGTQEYIIVGLIILPTWFLLIKSLRLAEMHRTKTYSMILASYLRVVVLGLGVIFLAVFLLKLNSISRLMILTFGLLNLVTLFSTRILTYKIS